LKREILNEFYTSERNLEDISPQKINKEFKKVFTKIKTNKRKFETNYFENDEYKVIKSEEVLEGCFLTLRIEPKINIDNIDILIEDLSKLLYETFKILLKQKKGLRVQVYLSGLFYHVIKSQKEEKAIISKNKYILNKSDIKSVISSILNKVKTKIYTWDSNEAYWRLQKVLYIDLKLREYKPISGSSYIPTPKLISDTK
jgi:hypothetical protein